MKGLDISFSKPSAQWWQDRKAEGYGIAVQCVWTGGFASNEGIKAAAETNLRNARLAGFRVAVYANASPPDWWPLVTQMQNIRANMGGEWDRVKDVVIDVEIPGITEARVMELADGLEAVSKIADVLYTARWFWVGHMGNSKDIAWRRFRLWSAHYDWNPDIDFGDNPYGPWTLAEVIGEQYQGSTDVAGGTIDLNTFKDSWMEDDMGMTPEQQVEMDALKAWQWAHSPFLRDGDTGGTPAYLIQGKTHRLITPNVWEAMERNPAEVITVPGAYIRQRAPERGPNVTLAEARAMANPVIGGDGVSEAQARAIARAEDDKLRLTKTSGGASTPGVVE